MCKPSCGLPLDRDDFCHGWELKGTLAVYLGFMHLALMFPASPLLPAVCLCPACCRPAGSAELLGTSQPVADLSSGTLESAALAQHLQGASQVLHEWHMFVLGGRFPGSKLGVEGFRRKVEAAFPGEVGTSL